MFYSNRLEKDLESAKARTLIWSLDKFLRYVPVSALWDKDRGYLVQNYASVVLALASRQNLAFRPVRKNEWQALGVGVSKGAEGFAPLSYVPEELQAIVRDSSAQPKKREFGIIAGRRLLDEQFTYDNLLQVFGKLSVRARRDPFQIYSRHQSRRTKFFSAAGQRRKADARASPKRG